MQHVYQLSSFRGFALVCLKRTEFLPLLHCMGPRICGIEHAVIGGGWGGGRLLYMAALCKVLWHMLRMLLCLGVCVRVCD